MTEADLVAALAELVESLDERPFIEVQGRPRRTGDRWEILLMISQVEGSSCTTSIAFSGAHSDTRIRAFLAAVGRFLRAHPTIHVSLGHADLIGAPIADDAFDRVLADARAAKILNRETFNKQLIATVDRGPVPILSNPELEAAIVARPDDVDAYAVYGDWLAQRGDPRGELVALQIARASRPDDAVLAKREAELLQTNAYEWLGELAWGSPGEVIASWRYGFLERLQFGDPTDEEAFSRIDVKDVLPALAKLPNLGLLRDVEVDGELGWPGHQVFWTSLASAGLPPSVRRLAFTARYKFICPPIDISPTYPALRRLDDLELGFHEMEFGPTLPLSNLRRLALWRVSRANAASMARSSWPHLERLFLCVLNAYADEHMKIAAADLEWLLEARVVPELRHLGLAGGVTGELVTALAGSPLVRQLTTLDLTEARVTFDVGQAVAAAMPAFAHLEFRPPTRAP